MEYHTSQFLHKPFQNACVLVRRSARQFVNGQYEDVKVSEFFSDVYFIS